MPFQHDWKWINAVVYAKSDEERDQVYTKWAPEYDADLAGVDSVGNQNMIKLAFKFINNEESSLMLDVAAGTGRTAQFYKEAGFKGQIDAIEMNAAMLNVARSKNLYRKHILHAATHDDPLPVENGTYDVATVAAAFTTNGLPQGCIRHMANALKPGGVLVFNSRKTDANVAYQKVLFGHLDQMVQDKKIEMVMKEEITYYGKPCMETGKPMLGFAFVYRRL